ncbi:MAG: hypothetical protein J6U54_12390, partial [Clostridiales bacterium]|nr:hypothetical protein [Clostridiales bacterium]
IGIGGISMSGLALLAKGYGFHVGGSDMNPSERTEMLKGKGIKIYDSQVEENLKEFQPDYAVKTAACLPTNKEVKYCTDNDIKMFDRSEFLGLITESYGQVINISGTHGKTTTTAMTSLMLLESGKDPTVHLGADFYSFNGTVRLGKGKDLLVSEACEFKKSFLNFSSTTAAITNIDHDHVDCYPKLQDVIDVFALFLDKLADGGNVVVTGHCKNTAESLKIASEKWKAEGREMFKVFTCGVKGELCEYTGKEPDMAADDISYDGGLPSFDVWFMGEKIGRANLLIPGKHNIDNSLIALCCAILNGGDPASCLKALNEFKGADGRYTTKGTYRGATVVVDYAHHPAAARATIEAASHMPHNNMWVVFQPLTFNRTKMLFEDYVTSLLPCKKVLFSEIFSDREINTHEISSLDISNEINKRGGDTEFFENKEDIIGRLDELVKEGDLILILGPEDIRELGDELIKRESK